MNNYRITILTILFCIQSIYALDQNDHRSREYNPEATATLSQYASATFFYRHHRAEDSPPPNWQHGRLLQEDFRKDFFARVRDLVVRQKADPNVSFITETWDEYEMGKDNLLYKVLNFEKNFPDKGGLDVARDLLEHGADPNHTNALRVASSRAIRLLGAFGAVDKPLDQNGPNARSRLAHNLLSRERETFCEKLEKIKALCFIGSDVNCSYQEDGKTPLEILLNKERYSECEKCEIIGVLVDYGLNLYERKGASFSLMKKQLAFKNVRELSCRFHAKVNATMREYKAVGKKYEEESMSDRLLRESLDKLCKTSESNVLNHRWRTIQSLLEKDAYLRKMEDDAKKKQVRKTWHPTLIPIGVHHIAQNKKWWWQQGYASRVSD